jgi:hypothetical protein
MPGTSGDQDLSSWTLSSECITLELVIRANLEWETRRARAAGIINKADDMLPVYGCRWATFHT